MTSPPPPVPEGSLLLHIGPQKTGSTALQQAMHAARDTLAEHGVQYPGRRQRPAEAGWAVMGIPPAVGRPPPRMSRWRRLCSEIDGSDLPRTCLSNEDFARANPAAVERIVGDLGAERIHLVYVARRLDRLLPSQWQERVKARLTAGYPEFLHTMLPDTGDPWSSTLWRPQHVGRVIERWAAHLDRSQITVLVSNEADRSFIPRSFEHLLGLPAGLLEPPAADRTNRSLTYPEVEVVRRLNRLFAEQERSGEEYWRIVQGGVVRRLRSRDTDHFAIPPLPGWALDRVGRMAATQQQEIRDSGVRVIGDLENLRPPDPSEATDGTGGIADDGIDTVPLALLVEVVAGVLEGTDVLRRRARREGEQERQRMPADPAGVRTRDLAARLGRRARRVARRR